METGWMICVGNPVDGFKFYGGADGSPFGFHDEAVEAAERHFGKDADPWCIVPLNSVSDDDEEEDDE